MQEIHLYCIIFIIFVVISNFEEYILSYKKIIFICILLSHIKLYCNDGVFFTRGDTIFPIQETKIELIKEIIVLDTRLYKNEYDQSTNEINVNVYFEFFNPDNDKELIVGFITPVNSTFSDIKPESRIKNFNINMNGNLLKYDMQKLSKDQIKDLEKWYREGDYAFLFKAPFKKGKNVIIHTYKYLGGSDSLETKYFNYRLLTGNLWANKNISDFEMFVFLNEKEFISITDFNWNIIGLGKEEISKHYNSKTFFIYSGYLHFKQKNFKPDKDFRLAIIGDMDNNYTNYDKYPKFDTVRDCVDLIKKYKKSDNKSIIWLNKEIKTMSSYRLNLLRNTIFALKGYVFIDSNLENLFRDRIWYFPNPNIKNDINILDKKEKELFNLILEYEK